MSDKQQIVLTKEELEQMVDQAMKLFDPALISKNPARPAEELDEMTKRLARKWMV